jgi:7-cyano-7-deazaguanine synthase
MDTKLFCLLSGGLDSSVGLAVMLKKFFPFGAKPDMAMAVSINYGQRHSREIDAAKRVADHYKVEHRTVNLTGVLDSTMLTDPSIPLPNASYEDLPHGISPTYVPFRNGMMLSVLAAIAQGWVRVDEKRRQAVLAFGAHAEDAANWAYPDCTPQFIEFMQGAIYTGTYMKVRLIAPFAKLTKDEIVITGNRMGVPLEYTWSCYAGGEKHCGTCPTCRARKAAFDAACVIDPTEYAA